MIGGSGSDGRVPEPLGGSISGEIPRQGQAALWYVARV